MRLAVSLTMLLLPPFGRAAAPPVDYLREVKPILAKNCFQCHGLKAQKGGLRVDTVKALLEGGDNGAAIVPGNAAGSLLIKAVSGADGVTRMPLKKPALTAEQVALLRSWIDDGARVPANDPVDDGKQGTTHWAFVPPIRPTIPVIPGSKSGGFNGIDAFILEKLRAVAIDPASEASPETLIRRVSLDLVGLPPSPTEVDAFLAARRVNPQAAYAAVVERLLASPHYGERWGRHWLDLARYADSNGYSIDAPREIWKYRDWVIDAVNHDMPFDRFTIEQIAGDLLPDATVDNKIATGFHRNTQINQEGGIDPEQFRVEAVSDRVSTTGTVWLGLTLGCCRCHDHKYDPVTQKEFYRLFAFLNNCDEPNLPIASPNDAAEKDRIAKRLDALEVDLKKEEARVLGAIPEDDREKYREFYVIHNRGPEQRTDGEKQTIFKFVVGRDPQLKGKVNEYNRLKRATPKFATTMVLAERKAPRETYIHLGGDFTRRGEVVTPGVPAALHSLADVHGTSTSTNRLDLARWLVDRNNPLTARVTVNRIWQQYFGKGIVETENDFGVQGAPPTHPELLDWLAVEFMDSGWSMKHIHRLIVTSAVYRRSSHFSERGSQGTVSRSEATSNPQSKDPANRLLARQNRLRLDAEIIRDSALTVSGLLNPKLGGPGVRPPQPDGVFKFTQVKRDWVADAGADRFRRGMYTYFWRAAPYPSLLVFDSPDAFATCTRRLRSNTPLQALTLLNDQAFVEQAQGLARRVLTEATDDRGRLGAMFRTCLGRAPSDREARRLREFLAAQQNEYKSDADGAKQFAGDVPGEPAVAAAWVAVARVMLNLDEFITRE